MNSLKKIRTSLLIAVMVVAMLLIAAQAAAATVSSGGAPSAPQTGGASSTSVSTASASDPGKTGVEMILFATVGAGLLGAGYLLMRKSKD